MASAPPTITGTTTAGDLLSATHGAWSNSPTSYTETWQRCNSSGGACVAISGASGESYRLTADDVGHALRVREIASGLGGTGAPAVSPATAVVKAAPVAPVASAPPAITGTARAGDLLTATHGTGPTARPVNDRWQRCSNTRTICTPIAGASGLAYRPTALDVGYALRVSETASNSAGASTPATSAPTALVQAATTGGGGSGTGGGGGTGGSGAGGTGGGGGGGGPAPAPALVRATTSGPLARVTVSCAAACRLTLTITVTETLRRREGHRGQRQEAQGRHRQGHRDAHRRTRAGPSACRSTRPGAGS